MNYLIESNSSTALLASKLTNKFMSRTSIVLVNIPINAPASAVLAPTAFNGNKVDSKV